MIISGLDDLFSTHDIIQDRKPKFGEMCVCCTTVICCFRKTRGQGTCVDGGGIAL